MTQAYTFQRQRDHSTFLTYSKRGHAMEPLTSILRLRSLKFVLSFNIRCFTLHSFLVPQEHHGQLGWTNNTPILTICKHILDSWGLSVFLSSFPKLPSNYFTLKGWTTFTSIWSAFPIHNPNFATYPVHWAKWQPCWEASWTEDGGWDWFFVPMPMLVMLQPCWNTHSQGAPWPKMSHNVAHGHQDWYQDIAAFLSQPTVPHNTPTP